VLWAPIGPRLPLSDLFVLRGDSFVAWRVASALLRTGLCVSSAAPSCRLTAPSPHPEGFTQSPPIYHYQRTCDSFLFFPISRTALDGPPTHYGSSLLIFHPVTAPPMQIVHPWPLGRAVRSVQVFLNVFNASAFPRLYRTTSPSARPGLKAPLTCLLPPASLT